MLSTITAALKATKEFLHWRRVEAEIRARRLVLEETEKIDEEIAVLEKRMHTARADGNHELADWLQSKRTRRALYRAGIYSVEEGSILPSTTRHDAGDGVGGATEGRTDQ